MADRPTIIIFSHSLDQGTNGVAQWLLCANVNVLRFNDDEEFPLNRHITLTESDCVFEYEGRTYGLNDVDAIWYRKGGFWFSKLLAPDGFEADSTLRDLLERKLKAEVGVASKFLYRLVKENPAIRVLGNPSLGDPNKLEMLHEAKAVGLTIPAYEVTTRLSSQHFSNPTQYITKAISDGVYLWDTTVNNRAYFTYTERLDEILVLGQEGSDIPLSLIQEKVPKAFELRVFYLDGNFYSNAIYSQNDEQTAVDYRKYNLQTPNRNVPYQLPDGIKRKLCVFFRNVKLNTASVDMIVTPDGDFVFLEVNPFGIYSGISETCNLNLDRAIALWLCGGQHEGIEAH